MCGKRMWIASYFGFAMLLTGPGTLAAGDPSAGNWTLDRASSRLNSSAIPVSRSIRSQPGGWLVVTTLYALHGGKFRRESFRLRPDGQDYPVQGVAGYDTVSWQYIDALSSEVVFKRDLREVSRCTTRHALAGRTSSTECVVTGPAGQQSASLAIWNRQGTRP
jgi:hypothetical protein